MFLHQESTATGEVPIALSELAYIRIKQAIFEFELIPGDRFSESAIADRLDMSRTPVRDALSRLQREGYLEVQSRAGWSVKPIDFEQFGHQYDLRLLLETTAVHRLCEGKEADESADELAMLKEFWLVPGDQRLTDGNRLATMDEQFHQALVRAAGNPEMARVHREVSERLRIIRRLDFSMAARIQDTYNEHAQILSAILARRGVQAKLLLRSHIEASKAEVYKITLHRLYTARKGGFR